MYDKILVPLDGSKVAECVLPHVEALAKDCRPKEIVLFRVCEPMSVLADYPASMPETFEEHANKMTVYSNQQCGLYLKDVEKRLKSDGIGNIKLDTALGDPARQITAYADKNQIDLIIMASHGRSGPSRWAYGSVADKVFRSTCVPVLMIRGPGCVVGV